MCLPLFYAAPRLSPLQKHFVSSFPFPSHFYLHSPLVTFASFNSFSYVFSFFPACASPTVLCNTSPSFLFPSIFLHCCFFALHSFLFLSVCLISLYSLSLPRTFLRFPFLASPSVLCNTSPSFLFTNAFLRFFSLSLMSLLLFPFLLTLFVYFFIFSSLHPPLSHVTPLPPFFSPMFSFVFFPYP